MNSTLQFLPSNLSLDSINYMALDLIFYIERLSHFDSTCARTFVYLRTWLNKLTWLTYFINSSTLTLSKIFSKEKTFEFDLDTIQRTSKLMSTILSPNKHSLTLITSKNDISVHFSWTIFLQLHAIFHKDNIICSKFTGN